MIALHNACHRYVTPQALVWFACVTAAQPAYAALPDEPPGVILHVGKDGTAEHASIQRAIDAAPPGAMIRVGPGTYDEHLRLDKPLTLEGAGWSQTTVAGPCNMDRQQLERATPELQQRLLHERQKPQKPCP